MKPGKTAALSMAALLLAALGSDWAEARPGHRNHHHRHHHHGVRVVLFATPLFVPRYYAPAPVYYAPPPVYIEQPQPQAQAYWYYCRELRAYYPYVQTCPGAWQRVVPQPPPG